MRNWTKGLLITYGEDQYGGMSELDTVKCYHCGFGSVMQPFQRPAMCRACMQFICERCADKRDLGEPCVPEERRLDDFEKAIRRGMEAQTAARKYGL